MNSKSKIKTILIATSALMFFLIVITEPSLKNFHNGFFNKYESGLLEPVFYLSGYLFLSSLILVWFSDKIFSTWYKIFKWFGPIAVLLTFLADSGTSYAGMSRFAVASLFGQILVVGTLIFALVQKFIYKV